MLGIFRSLIAVIILAIAAPASLAQEHRDADRNNAPEEARQHAGERREQNGHEQGEGDVNRVAKFHNGFRRRRWIF